MKKLLTLGNVLGLLALTIVFCITQFAFKSIVVTYVCSLSAGLFVQRLVDKKRGSR
jgi:hypothetical protein